MVQPKDSEVSCIYVACVACVCVCVLGRGGGSCGRLRGRGGGPYSILCIICIMVVC